MAHDVERGQIWMYGFRPPDKRRPVLVLTRPALLKVLRQVIVSPITSTLRETDTEVRLGIDFLVALRKPEAPESQLLQTPGTGPFALCLSPPVGGEVRLLPLVS